MTGAPAGAIGGYRRITVRQGETHVSDDPAVLLTTVLGSCIAVCLHDPIARAGGINHFLLAQPGAADTDMRSLHGYGVFAMEALINAMLAMGATRPNLRARLYGGATLHGNFRGIGTANVLFARRSLRTARIALVGENIGGSSARRVEFRPAQGLARCRAARGHPLRRPLVASPRPAPSPLH